MDSFAHFSRTARFLGSIVLLFASFAATADNVQDITKLYKHGQQAQALEMVNRFLSEKPTNAQARFLKGLILTNQGKVDEAIHVYEELTLDDPELPEPYNNLAVLFASQGKYGQARVALEKAIRVQPDNVTAYDNLGDVYAKLALQSYKKTLQLDHSKADTQSKLKIILQIFNSSDNAKPLTTINAPSAVVPADSMKNPATSMMPSMPAKTKPAAAVTQTVDRKN